MVGTMGRNQVKEGDECARLGRGAVLCGVVWKGLTDKGQIITDMRAETGPSLTDGWNEQASTLQKQWMGRIVIYPMTQDEIRRHVKSVNSYWFFSMSVSSVLWWNQVHGCHGHYMLQRILS